MTVNELYKKLGKLMIDGAVGIGDLDVVIQVEYDQAGIYMPWFTNVGSADEEGFIGKEDFEDDDEPNAFCIFLDRYKPS